MAAHDEKSKLRTYLIPHLRRASKRFPNLAEAARNARVERGRYKCAMCESIVGASQYAIDHIDPVVNPETGFTTWDEYIERLFCPADKLQVICLACHDTKTALERELRTMYRKERKAKETKDDNETITVE